MKPKDNLAGVVSDDEPLERVPISKRYSLVLLRSLVGTNEAVTIALRMTGDDGAVREKLSFRVFPNRLDDLADAIRRVSKRLASEGE